MDSPYDFHEKGFAIIPGVLEEQDIAKLAHGHAGAQLRRSKAGVRHALKHSAVAEVAQDARLLDVARGVLGSGAVPFRATLFDKSPESNWLVAWHQDTALPLRERHETSGWGPWSVKDGVIYAHAPASALCQVLALRVHLDDSTADNGSEYDAMAFTEILDGCGIMISRSRPGCPWENGYQESFYDKFKVDLGDPNRFKTLRELVAEIYSTLWDYNNTRIHSALNMPPVVFAKLDALVA